MVVYGTRASNISTAIANAVEVCSDREVQDLMRMESVTEEGVETKKVITTGACS
jgi:hypothetical protein